MNWSAALVELVWPLPVTVTSTVPEPAGLVAVIDVALFTVTPVAAVEPNATVSPDAKPVPVMVTVVPPATGPLVGLTALTATGGTYVNVSAELVELVCPPLVTVTSTVPEPAGLVAVIDVALFTVTPVAAVPPNATVAPDAKPVPEMVTGVPPAAGPLAGLTPDTVGGAM